MTRPFIGDPSPWLRFFTSVLFGQIVFDLSFCLGGCQSNYCTNDKMAHDDLLCLYVLLRGFGQSLFDLS